MPFQEISSHGNQLRECSANTSAAYPHLKTGQGTSNPQVHVQSSLALSSCYSTPHHHSPTIPPPRLAKRFPSRRCLTLANLQTVFHARRYSKPPIRSAMADSSVVRYPIGDPRNTRYTKLLSKAVFESSAGNMATLHEGLT